MVRTNVCVVGPGAVRCGAVRRGAARCGAMSVDMVFLYVLWMFSQNVIPERDSWELFQRPGPILEAV